MCLHLFPKEFLWPQMESWKQRLGCELKRSDSSPPTPSVFEQFRERTIFDPPKIWPLLTFSTSLPSGLCFKEVGP